MHIVTGEQQGFVADEGAGQQAGLRQDLKAVAYPEHRAPGAGKGDDFLHDGRKTRNGAATQIIAIGESTRQHHRITAREGLLLVPDKFRLLTKHMLDGMVGVMVAIGPGKNNDGESHWQRLSGFDFFESEGKILHDRIGQKFGAGLLHRLSGNALIIFIDLNFDEFSCANRMQTRKVQKREGVFEWPSLPDQVSRAGDEW